MKFLLIPDKFKGSLTSKEVAEAFMTGVKQVDAKATSKFIMASDGGDGFMNAISSYKTCISIQVIAQNPLGKLIQSYYLYNQKSNSAYIEMANTSGMELLEPTERNPLLTSTLGTGNQIKDAINKGIKRIYIGLGGSATNDGGIGLAHALGYRFLDQNGQELEPIGGSLNGIVKIDHSKVPKSLKEVSFYAVNDVNNPLFGKRGAAFVYAKQKGADDAMIKKLDSGLQNLDCIVTQQFGYGNAEIPGSGAAGGTAYGLKTFLNAEFISGIDFILDLAGVHELLSNENFNVLVTGEGKIDQQTLSGKLIQGVLRLGKKYNLPVMAVCGKLEVSQKQIKSMGLTSVIEIQNPLESLEYNLKNAAELLTLKAAKHFSLQTN